MSKWVISMLAMVLVTACADDRSDGPQAAQKPVNHKLHDDDGRNWEIASV